MLWALLLLQSIVALKQGFGTSGRRFSTLAVPHQTSSGSFKTQADVSVMYYKYSPSLEQSQAYDLSGVTFQLDGDGNNVCMMVSSHELPITPMPNLSACHDMNLKVAISSSSPEFCAPSTELGACSYFIGIRVEGDVFPELKIGVDLDFTEPLFRHLFVSRDVTDHLRKEQRFKYVLPPGMPANQVVFSVNTDPVLPVSTRAEIMVSLAGFPSGSTPQIGVTRASLPKLEVAFNKAQLEAFTKLYKNTTFFVTLSAPGVSDADYLSSPSFTLKTRVLGESGQPVPQPTAPPTAGRRKNSEGSSSDTHSNITSNNILWVWTARFLGVLAVCLLLSCVIKSIRYMCKDRAERQAEALGDMLHHSKQNLEDAWSIAALQAQADRDEDMQVIRSAAL